MFRKIISFIKEILFPVFCVQCGAEGEWWCEECWQKIKINPIAGCPVCGVRTSRGETCSKCGATSFLNGVVALFNYRENEPIAKLIKQFKYNFAGDLKNFWPKIIQKTDGSFLPWRDFVIISIPLHARRQRERGFNQAEVLARVFADNFKRQGISCPLDTKSLIRTRYTLQQAKLSRAERHHNLLNAFIWRGGPAPERAVLVDDVFTTGATMQEAAKVLKQAGTKEVWGLALARD